MEELTAVPHFPQNFFPGMKADPQFGHVEEGTVTCGVGTCITDTPQFPQNFFPGTSGVWQEGQNKSCFSTIF